MDAKYFREVTAPILSNSFNVVSIVASTLVLIISLTLGFYKPSMMNRVTLRLQIGVSFFDLLTHIFSLFHHLKETTPAFCTFIGFYRSFGNMVYCFLNIAIALNLQLVFLHSLQPKIYWEIGYWVATLGLSIIANIPLLALDYFGKNSDNLCFLNKDKPEAFLIQAININGVMIFTCLYCLCISVFVVVKLLKSVNVLKSMSTVASITNSGSSPKVVDSIKKLIFRVSLYPIVCCLCLSGFIARFFVASAGGDNKTPGWILWSLLGLTTTGLLNFIAFCCDPTLQNAALAFYKEYRSKSFTKNRSGNSSNNHSANQEFAIELNESHSDTGSKNADRKEDETYDFDEMNQGDNKALGEFMKFL